MNFSKITQVFKVKELRRKLFYTFFLLIIFRIAAHIPVPGVDVENLKEFFAGNQIFGLLDIFTGGGLSKLSVVMMGVGPYITASIIMQLLMMIFPKLEEWYREEGEEGKRKFNQITRYLTIPLAALQSYAMINMLSRGDRPAITNLTPFNLATTVISVIAGTMFLVWIGELITEYGIGNGVSLIIFGGIIARLPMSIQQNVLLITGAVDLIKFLAYIGVLVLMVIGVVIITQGQRNIPVSYARRIRGNKMYGGVSTHLPLRVNTAGVIPIIFAMSVMLFPGVVANFLVNASNEIIAKAANYVAGLFKDQAFYASLYFMLVVAFTYFYTAIIFEPKSIAENLQKQGGFIPGKRPGSQTAEYLSRVINRITLAGALFLGGIAIMPFALEYFTGIKNMTLEGTALLIVVSVIIETVKQVQAQLVMRDYEGF